MNLDLAFGLVVSRQSLSLNPYFHHHAFLSSSLLKCSGNQSIQGKVIQSSSVTPSGFGREGRGVEARNEGAGGEEVKLLDDGGNWESDIKTSLSDAMERFDGDIMMLGKSTDGDGEEGRLEKERWAILPGLGGR
jgi:hypothetical protein